ncbi:hypothetical protein EPUS_07618 [Endocarpon pusillum Z07020]|uniref:Uncharacterized protein n=1 Tax=Endocarpon pusillum (strain Z07020 / HMAS-L-300199) TaxID=1263415 RepID=U1GE42_ENDPU|nr:uncharacterized protein EPUS_07618 [Endocarpon pusillum Z07020]ERF70353.1 hypothetical protein EPUS_07618 [Endocarpon pusillum Z07020]
MLQGLSSLISRLILPVSSNNLYPHSSRLQQTYCDPTSKKASWRPKQVQYSPLESHTQLPPDPPLPPPNPNSANVTPSSSTAPTSFRRPNSNRERLKHLLFSPSLPSQGPKGTSTQQKTVKPDGADKPGEGKGTLKEAAMKNVTMLGDPVSLKAETSEHSPKPEEDGATERLRSKI